jgi:glyoxylase-like metal-dependent hydrolase (beta-lactamase superfamily II)
LEQALASFEIHPLDLNFLGHPQTIASFLVIGPGGPLLIETGPGTTTGALQSGLARFGLRPADIHDVLLTHIHLDHAGAAGWMAQQGATIHVHQAGAPHLAQPERLLTSARRIYGDDMDRLWGEFLPVPAAQLRPLRDGDVVAAGGLSFTALDTPGHAGHHLVYQLDDLGFAGDLGGVRRPGIRHVRVPTPPPEFDRALWLASIEKVRARGLARLYLTHFGPVDDVDEHLSTVARLVDAYAEQVRAALARGLARDAIVAEFAAWEQSRLEADGVPPAQWPVYADIGPVGMAVDGLLRYWNKQAKASSSG